MGLSMRKLRVLMILATVLTLPSYGLAGIAYARSCQEQMRAPSHAELSGDCCPGKGDQNTPCKERGTGSTGKNGPCSPCKAGFNCKSPQSYEPASSIVLTLE